jgi:hypothetical protein
MGVALFADPSDAEYASAIEAATFVAETAIGLGQSLILSCGPSAALDIGLAVLGQSDARTVEGGERRPSPIILLPMIRDTERPADAWLRPAHDEESPGTLADLVDFGVIARGEESGIDPFGDDDSLDVFLRTIRNQQVSVVFGLGSQSRFWTPTLRQLREIPQGRLIAIQDFYPSELPEEETIIRIRRAEIPDRSFFRDDDHVSLLDDEFEQDVMSARRQAALTAALIEALLQRS